MHKISLLFSLGIFLVAGCFAGIVTAQSPTTGPCYLLGNVYCKDLVIDTTPCNQKLCGFFRETVGGAITVECTDGDPGDPDSFRFTEAKKHIPDRTVPHGIHAPEGYTGKTGKADVDPAVTTDCQTWHACGANCSVQNWNVSCDEALWGFENTPIIHEILTGEICIGKDTVGG